MTARDPIDALAEVLRLWQLGGLFRPLWENLEEFDREGWRVEARFICDALNRREVDLVWTSAASGGSKP